MATPLPALNGVEIKLVWTFNAQPFALNILHGQNQTPIAITQAVADALDIAVKGALSSSALASQLNSGVALAHLEMRSMTSNEDPWFVAAGAPAPGTSTENPLPAATALVVSLRTGKRGRSFNGRFYQFGYSELANDAAGGATATAATATRAFVDAVSTAMQSGGRGIQMAVLSRVTTPPGASAPIVRPTPVLTPVTAAVMADQRWDTQRRRAIPGI